MAGPPAFDIEVPQFRVEPTPRRIRVRAGEHLLADSSRALLLAWYGPGMLPTYCLPDADVRTDLLVPAGGGGDAPFDEYDVRSDGVELERAARRFERLEGPLARANGHWTFTWDGAVTWLEEAQEVRVHARDPSKRVDVVASDRHVRVELDGELIAESRRPHALFETTLPTRWYLPPEDVRLELLEPSDTVTSCPYKGTARFWSVRTAAALHRDVCWSYPEPVPECPRIAGLIAFFNEHVDLVIDGEPQRRPFTPWSLGASGQQS